MMIIRVGKSYYRVKEMYNTYYLCTNGKYNICIYKKDVEETFI